MRSRHWPLLRATWSRFTSFWSISLTSILILYSHLLVALIICHFNFPAKMLFLISCMRATCTSRLRLLNKLYTFPQCLLLWKRHAFPSAARTEALDAHPLSVLTAIWWQYINQKKKKLWGGAEVTHTPGINWEPVPLSWPTEKNGRFFCSLPTHNEK
jgi:hypothetical protein